jgi:hypothetical protein
MKKKRFEDLITIYGEYMLALAKQMEEFDESKRKELIKRFIDQIPFKDREVFFKFINIMKSEMDRLYKNIN